MRRIYVYFKSLLLIAVFVAPLVCTGCAVRVHDHDYRDHDENFQRDHQDYHHDQYRDFYRLNFNGMRAQ